MATFRFRGALNRTGGKPFSPRRIRLPFVCSSFRLSIDSDLKGERWKSEGNECLDVCTFFKMEGQERLYIRFCPRSCLPARLNSRVTRHTSSRETSCRLSRIYSCPGINCAGRRNNNMFKRVKMSGNDDTITITTMRFNY